MDIRNRRGLKQQAVAALETSPNQKKIIAVYAGVNLLLVALLLLVDFLLSSMIEKTSGLSNIGTRIILQTIQDVLPLGQSAFFLFWQYGYLSAAMGISRHRMTDHRELTGAFRLVGPIIRLTLLQYGISFLLSFAAMYLSIIVFAVTPFARPLMEAIAANMTDTIPTATELMANPGIVAAANDAVLPLMCIFLVIICLLVLPITYLFRMAGYCLLDNPHAGALAALRTSRNMMRSNRLNLLKLDVSFWWYYLLVLVAMAICYGDSLLPLVGISLPLSETGSYYLFYGLYLVVQFAYSYFFQNYIEVTYVQAYEALKPKPQGNGVILGNIFQM